MKCCLLIVVVVVLSLRANSSFVESALSPWSKQQRTHKTRLKETRQSSSSSSASQRPQQQQQKRRQQKRQKPIPYIATTSNGEHQKAMERYLREGDNVLVLSSSSSSSGGEDAAAQEETMIQKLVGETGRVVSIKEFSHWRSALQLLETPKEQKMANNNNINSLPPNTLLLKYDILILDVPAMLGNDLLLTTMATIQEFVDWMQMDQPNNTLLKLDHQAQQQQQQQQQQQHLSHRGVRRPRAVLVKSKVVASLARRLISAPRLLDGTETTIARGLIPPPTTTTNPVDSDDNHHGRSGRPPPTSRPFILACVGVEEYRRTIPYVVQRGDRVLEVGCFSGTTTALLHKEASGGGEVAVGAAASTDDDGGKGGSSGGYAIGVDIGPKIISRAQKEHPDIHFAIGDGFRSLDLLRIQQQQQQQQSSCDGTTTTTSNILNQQHEQLMSGYDVVYADIGGLSGPHGLLESLSLLEGLEYGLEPRGIVIKSLCMRRLASSLRAYSDLKNRKTS